MTGTPSSKTPLSLDESLLADLPLFANLSAGDVQTIVKKAHVRRFDTGQIVFDEGEPADRFYLLLDGVIRVLRLTAEGEQVISLHIPSGQFFGIAKALGHSAYPATAVAAADLLCLSWPMQLWSEFAARYAGLATETYKNVGTRIDEMNARIMEMATQHVEQRVANGILRLINQVGQKSVDGIEIAFPVTRQDISEMTGTTLHTVSRMLSGWEKQGVIKSGRKRITVCDPHKLVLLSAAPLG